MVKAVESDWATEKATRVIRGYRILASRGRELRDEIAKELRRVEARVREEERLNHAAQSLGEGLGVGVVPAADRRVTQAQASS